jgi:hypothetical protein
MKTGKGRGKNKTLFRHKMARYFFNRKRTVEECDSISVVRMKEWGFFKGLYRSGEISWKSSWRGEASISYTFDLEERKLRLVYSFGENKDDPQDYFVRLSTTKCQFGGVRYWMHCPKCNKRVGKLYLAGKYIFACRDCWNLSYEIRNAVGLKRRIGKTPLVDELCEMFETMRVKYYKGKPTKRYLRCQKYSDRLTSAFSRLGIWRK